jgi:hypothetical protein
LTLTHSDLNEYSLNDIWAAYCGYWLNESLKERGEWERARYVAFSTLAPHSKSFKKPKDLGLFPWEYDTSKKGTKGNPWTREELKEQMKLHPKFYK